MSSAGMTSLISGMMVADGWATTMINIETQKQFAMMKLLTDLFTAVLNLMKAIGSACKQLTAG